MIGVVMLEFDKYHLIPTPVYTSFKPPSVQKKEENLKNEASRIILKNSFN